MTGPHETGPHATGTRAIGTYATGPHAAVRTNGESLNTAFHNTSLQDRA